MNSMKKFYRVFAMILALGAATLACDVPDSWINVLSHLPTMTPTPPPLTLYVSTTGNDAHDCLSVATACSSVGAALGKATPGSTIHIGSGAFRWYGPLLPLHDVVLQGAGVSLTTLTSGSSDVVQLVHPARVEVRALTIAGDAGPHAGNGIEVRGGASLVLVNCRIHAKHWAVHVFVAGAASVANCTIESNDYGFENGGSLIVSNSIVRTNLSAVENYGTFQSNVTTFDGNGDSSTTSGAASPTINSERGGSVSMTGGSVSNNAGWGIILDTGTLALTGVTVNGNVGTGIWQTAGIGTIDTGLVQNNHGYGVEIGGRTGEAPGAITITRSAITGNQSAGLRIDGGEIHVQNSTINGNVSSSVGGGGIWGYGGNLYLLDSTVAYNTGDGVNLGVGETSPGVVTIRRSVVALNSGPECQIDSRVTLDTGGSTYVCNDSWTRATLKLLPLAMDAGTFVDPIDATSLLVDAGGTASACPSVDQRGYPRPAGRTCDVGAYEFGSSSAALVFATAVTDTPKDTPPGVIYIVTETPTLAPVPTLTATPTPALTPQVTFIKNGNCRKGPGLVYNIVTSLAQGAVAVPDGRDPQSQWVDILVPNTQAHCWVALTTVELNVPVQTFDILPLPPLPETPASLTDHAECVVKSKSLAVKLVWTDVPNESGYHVYRNGTLIDTVGANVTAYMDSHAPLGIGLIYEVEAFNANGSSERVQTTVPACK